MRTLLTIKQQEKFLSDNWNIETIEHRWARSGMSAKLLTSRGSLITKAGGCGYDRWGTLIGQFIEIYFPEELTKLAKRFCKTKGTYRNSSDRFYGLFLRDGKGYLDGGCGINCMEKVLACIGFELSYGVRGNYYETLTLKPVSKHKKDLIVKKVK